MNNNGSNNTNDKEERQNRSATYATAEDIAELLKAHHSFLQQNPLHFLGSIPLSEGNRIVERIPTFLNLTWNEGIELNRHFGVSKRTVSTTNLLNSTSSRGPTLKKKRSVSQSAAPKKLSYCFSSIGSSKQKPRTISLHQLMMNYSAEKQLEVSCG
uniref:Ovule protein n=1 Tax=Rhabditophanes sp. KR3021 TaxID=114890 RepID=A0AC35U959_9BILA